MNSDRRWSSERREVLERLAVIENNIEAAEDWKAQRALVLQTLERFERAQGEIFSKINVLTVDLSVMKVKSGVWGAVGALIPLVLAGAVGYVFSSCNS